MDIRPGSVLSPIGDRGHGKRRGLFEVSCHLEVHTSDAARQHAELRYQRAVLAALGEHAGRAVIADPAWDTVSQRVFDAGPTRACRDEPVPGRGGPAPVDADPATGGRPGTLPTAISTASPPPTRRNPSALTSDQPTQTTPLIVRRPSPRPPPATWPTSKPAQSTRGHANPRPSRVVAPAAPPQPPLNPRPPQP
ncbi:MAG TPA: hypothetical protein VI365_34120, partial [Trebonia sp.]